MAEQDRTLQAAGNGPAEVVSLRNSGRLNRMKKKKIVSSHTRGIR